MGAGLGAVMYWRLITGRCQYWKCVVQSGGSATDQGWLASPPGRRTSSVRLSLREGAASARRPVPPPPGSSKAHVSNQMWHSECVVQHGACYLKWGRVVRHADRRIA
eukprot:2339840-Rhodomonas_salina.2